MRYVVLGKSGLKVSAVGFGGIPIQRVSEAAAVAAIHKAFDLGVNFIDTAAAYSDSQAKIGKAIARRRDGLVLASKSGQRTAAGILRDIDQARLALGVDVIDLYQLHGVAPETWPEISGVGGALEGVLAARDKGHIGHIGFSAHSLDFAMTLVERAEFETIQFPFNLVTQEPAQSLIPKTRRRGLGFIVMKPLCGGQYEDATLAFKFLNAYSDLVAIPGIETPQQIEQIVKIVDSKAVLEGAEKVAAEKIATDLGKLFCRRCGYCMPCPQGIPITVAMVFDGFLKRFSAERVRSDLAKQVAELGPKCTQCGLCRKKCPFDLPISETVAKAVEMAKNVLAEG